VRYDEATRQARIAAIGHFEAGEYLRRRRRARRRLALEVGVIAACAVVGLAMGVVL
jgi:hypothetical protein